MSRLISDILGVPRSSLALEIDELEKLSGRPGIDIKLAAELSRIFRQKAAFLGLDGRDTSAKELYFAMKNHVFENAKLMEKMLGVKTEDSPEQVVEKSMKFVKKRLGKKSVWALKPSVSRKQLKENPPKKLMKTFGIRSIDSALKREKPGLFYCFARYVEPKSWLGKHASQAAKLTNSDFDNLQITISSLDSKKCEQLASIGLRLNQIVYADQENASIILCAPSKRFTGDALFIVDTLLIQARNMLRRSEYYRVHGLRPDFFAKLEKIRQHGFSPIENHGTFDWQTLVHGTVEQGIADLIQGSEVSVAAEDIVAPTSSELLSLEFWKHPYALYHEPGLVISFNFSDMIINAINGVDPRQAYVEYGRNKLKNELFARYLHHEPVRQKATRLNYSEA